MNRRKFLKLAAQLLGAPLPAGAVGLSEIKGKKIEASPPPDHWDVTITNGNDSSGYVLPKSIAKELLRRPGTHYFTRTTIRL